MAELDHKGTLVLGTRGSKLALAQSGQVAEAITRATGVPVRMQVISTRGDRIQDRPLGQLGGKGLFTAELEDGLLNGEIDIAVHSLKDLPTDDAPGLILGCTPERADPRDALVGMPLSELPPGAVVGTGSLRRMAQLRAQRPDLSIQDIRGNVDTRLRKRDEGQYTAIVLALAGLARLGIRRDDVFPLSTEQMVPAVGQGTLAIQCRDGDGRVLDLLAAIEHPPSRRRAEAERAFLATYGGGCNVPAACHATLDGEVVELVAIATDSSGQLRKVTDRGPDGRSVARSLAEQLRGLVAG